MITEGEAAIPLETTLHAFRNQEKTKQRSTIVIYFDVSESQKDTVDFVEIWTMFCPVANGRTQHYGVIISLLPFFERLAILYLQLGR